MSIRATDGSTVTVSTSILDDTDSPVLPKQGYPKVALLDQDKVVIANFPAMPGSSAGSWDASLALPLLGVTRPTNYTLRWRCLSITGDKYSVNETLTVDPKAERRDSEIVVFADSAVVEFVMPIAYDASMGASYQVYHDNQPVLPAPVAFSDPSVFLDAGLDRTLVRIPPVLMDPSLYANLLTVRATVQGRMRTFSYKYWCITPQIAVAMTMVEDFLNKSRIENVIPELEYTDSDLVGYLERGLNLFNTIGIVTSFTGLNMRGTLLDCWLICTYYWALGSQLLAEGSLAFDFSGQGISLNVDRTPQLDAALGRIESRMQDLVLPFKKQITQQGILGGDGSQGSGTMRNPRNNGTLGLINAPTTRIDGWGYPGIRRV